MRFIADKKNKFLEFLTRSDLTRGSTRPVNISGA